MQKCQPGPGHVHSILIGGLQEHMSYYKRGGMVNIAPLQVIPFEMYITHLGLKLSAQQKYYTSRSRVKAVESSQQASPSSN